MVVKAINNLEPQQQTLDYVMNLRDREKAFLENTSDENIKQENSMIMIVIDCNKAFKSSIAGITKERSLKHAPHINFEHSGNDF